MPNTVTTTDVWIALQSLEGNALTRFYPVRTLEMRTDNALAYFVNNFHRIHWEMRSADADFWHALQNLVEPSNQRCDVIVTPHPECRTYNLLKECFIVALNFSTLDDEEEPLTELEWVYSRNVLFLDGQETPVTNRPTPFVIVDDELRRTIPAPPIIPIEKFSWVREGF